VSRIALLDVNLLVALFDADHVHHEIAHAWFADTRPGGWASCPMTENGLVRVLTNPKYGSPISAVPAVLERVRAFTASGHHEFWTDLVSLSDAALFEPARVRGHRQITDVYLLGLAHVNGGRLATFDRAIPLAAVIGATPDTLEVIEEHQDPE
jgi:toxin-antitoxin system PIN domain toxin